MTAGRRRDQARGRGRTRERGELPLNLQVLAGSACLALVVAVGDHIYLALPKGGFNKDHVLILPIGHHQSLASLPEEIMEEVDKFKSAIRKIYKKQGKVPVFWERNYRTQHLQIQVRGGFI